MKDQKYITVTGNQAVANIAYKTNEVCAIYPITPASEMSELVEEWCAKQKKNIFGDVPSVIQMQSEAGVAGAMHGALQTGSLSSTFTASQGLLLMMPNMYKIAGEMTPNVIHVATRSIATHALSVFGDHSDVMAVRSTGYAMLGAASVQEAQDFALISQAATLESKIPFVHFFDGFRTSHEINKIETISNDIIKAMIDHESVDTHRNRALNPNNPVIRGTAQGPDVFFQGREAVNTFYNACPEIVQNKMNAFARLTGRQYRLFDYVGDPQAEHIIISMASSTETIEKTIKYLNSKGEKIGLIKVRLFRPFSTKHLIEAIPTSVKSIAVLDRTKEPGASSEPLYLDVVQTLTEAFQNKDITTLPRIVGGRYGLSSKEFTPSMVKSIVDNLKKERPKHNFTVGIKDDITHLSLNFSDGKLLEESAFQTIYYQPKHKELNQNINSLSLLVGEGSKKFIQSHTECDYKKSNSTTITHVRIDSQPIKAPYLIKNADLIVCQDILSLEKDNALDLLKRNGMLLVNTSLTSNTFWQTLSVKTKKEIVKKNIQLYIVNESLLNEYYNISGYSVSGLHACFLALNKDIFDFKHRFELLRFIQKVDTSVEYKDEAILLENDHEFTETLLGKLLANRGNEIPVGMLPVDGTYKSNTSQYNPIQTNKTLPVWHPDLCTQCGACSMACPQGVLRIKAYDNSFLNNAPSTFKSIRTIEPEWELDLLNYTVQIHPEHCTACNNCTDACPSNALTLVNTSLILKEEKENWTHFETIPEFDREKININKVNQQQLQEPLFKYSIGVEGCGEAPYLKLLSQLFGDRLMVANATGSSSIFGGALPTTPWSKNKEGRGPAWSNSLFEDNAEFGLGFRLSLDQHKKHAIRLLETLLPYLDFDLVYDIIKAEQTTEKQINEQRKRVELLKKSLRPLDSIEAKQLINISDNLVKKSVWIVGGDGWAYDIGYGGLDHVIASGENVNILVLDNEVYDNTGGQASKATPFGAQAKFVFNGKQKQKKDLGRLAMTYNNVYVASVAIGADQSQTLKAFNEAESFNGPSIIIAYCHSDAHGIDMKNPSKYHKAAVDSGQWLLYRNDPRRHKKGLNSLQLDSKEPQIRIEDYCKMEKRYSKLVAENKASIKPMITEIQNNIDDRYNEYLYKSFVKSVNTVHM